MKKMISLLLSAVVVCMALCACGDKESGLAHGGKTASPDSLTATAPAAKATPDEAAPQLSDGQITACEKAAQAYVNLLYPRDSLDNYYEHQDEYLENFYKSAFFWAFYKNDLRYNCFSDLREWLYGQELPVCSKVSFSIKTESLQPLGEAELDQLKVKLQNDGMESKDLAGAAQVRFIVDISFRDDKQAKTAQVYSDDNMLIQSGDRWYLYQDLISANHVRSSGSSLPVSDVFRFENYDLINSGDDFNDFNDFNDYGDYGGRTEETTEEDNYVHNN